MNDEDSYGQRNCTCGEGGPHLIERHAIREPSWYAGAEAQEMEDVQHVQARIGVWMSDLEIVNEIIRVVGYERLDIISDMLEDRLLQVTRQGHFIEGA
jgi:hypothetical protein